MRRSASTRRRSSAGCQAGLPTGGIDSRSPRDCSLDEAYLWPGALSREQVAAASDSEVLSIYAHRSDVPRDVWERLFASAEREIGVLVYAGLFLAEDAAAKKVLAERARAGVRIRMLLGDPDSEPVAERGANEGVDDAMAAKIRNALALYRSLRGAQGVEFRFHQTILYNSIYVAMTSFWSTPTSMA